MDLRKIKRLGLLAAAAMALFISGCAIPTAPTPKLELPAAQEVKEVNLKWTLIPTSENNQNKSPIFLM